MSALNCPVTERDERECIYVVRSGSYLSRAEAAAAAAEGRAPETHQHWGQTVTIIPEEAKP